MLRGITVDSIDQDVGIDCHSVRGHLRRVAHGAGRSMYGLATKAVRPLVAALAGWRREPGVPHTVRPKSLARAPALQAQSPVPAAT